LIKTLKNEYSFDKTDLKEINDMVIAHQFGESTKSDITEAVDKELKKYGIKELKDNLTLDKIKSDYPWILKAKIKDAILGEDSEGIKWYDGNWKKGTWKGGTWVEGDWENGTFEDGTFGGGVWYDGVWKDKATWIGGTWEDGKNKPEDAEDDEDEEFDD
jgi:uncharacterized protein (DUF433 family)